MDDWLEDFRRTLDTATEQLLLIPEERAGIPKSERKWSAKQIIGHLIDSAANNHQRFVRAQFTDDLIFPGYEQEAWVQVQSYDQEPWLQLVQLWRHYNLHLLHVMSAVPEAVRTKSRSPHNLKRIGWRTI